MGERDETPDGDWLSVGPENCDGSVSEGVSLSIQRGPLQAVVDDTEEGAIVSRRCRRSIVVNGQKRSLHDRGDAGRIDQADENTPLLIEQG